MADLKTPLELYGQLPRTNCGKCGSPTCLAFAALVIQGERDSADCPVLERDAAASLQARVGRQVNLEQIREEQLRELRTRLAGLDLAGRAELLGGRADGRSLVIPCLGKDFTVGPDGLVASQCHTHSWFTLPLLDYVLHCAGAAPSGRWVPFRELPHGRTWAPLFEQRCEKPLKRIADAYSDLFADLSGMFSGSARPAFSGSDVSVLLHPLPHVPLLLCYWKAEEDMESKLHLFFDDTAEENLPVGSLFTLGTGIARMLERIMHTHTGGRSGLS